MPTWGVLISELRRAEKNIVGVANVGMTVARSPDGVTVARVPKNEAIGA